MNAFIGTDIGGYGFAPNVNQVSFFGVSITDLDQVLLITNVTTGEILFNFADPTVGGTLYASTLTLEKDCSAMNSTDSLQVICRIPDTVVNTANPTKVEIIKGQGDVGNLDVDLWGKQGQITQNERGQSNYDEILPQLTHDVNVEEIFGSQRVVNEFGELNVRSSPKEPVISFKIGVGERIIPLPEGTNSVGISYNSPAAVSPTITPFLSINGAFWVQPILDNIQGAANAPSATSLASNTIYQINTVGMAFLRVTNTGSWGYVSVKCSQQNKIPFRADWLRGSATNSLLQRSTTGFTQNDLIVCDQGLVKDAFIDPAFNPKGIYVYGDVVTWNGQSYYHTQSATNLNFTLPAAIPTNTTYWALDPRQNKSVVTSTYVSPPSAARMRVEVDLDALQIRAAESRDIQGKLLVQQALQNGVDYVNVGQSMSGGMANYLVEEIR